MATCGGNGVWLDDVHVGTSFRTAAQTVTEAHVVNFAGTSGDHHEVHTNAELMRTSRFGGRLAHGALVLSIVTGLRSRTGRFDDSIVALLEIRRWRFASPVVIGDTLRATCEVVEVRECSDPARGIVVEQIEVQNQRDEIVQDGQMVTMLRKRNAA